jgi:hypothetical protein
MKRYIGLLASLALLMVSCEDKNDDESGGSLVGTWELSDMGQYTKADCSGSIDNTGFAFAQLLGLKVTMTFTSDGKGTYSTSAIGETFDMSLTWDENKSEICIAGIMCNEYKLSGSKFTMDTKEEANCVDSDDNETDQTNESSCEAANNIWNEATCSIQEFTKK